MELLYLSSSVLQVWKRSGAWFFKGIPKYVLPEKKTGAAKYTASRLGQDVRGSIKSRPGTTRQYNTWSRGRTSHGIKMFKPLSNVIGHI